MIEESSEPARVEQILALADAVAAADGVAALSEQTLLHLRRPGRTVRHLTATGPQGVVHGYAQVDPAAGSAELAVHPAHRRVGTGRALLRAVRTSPVAVWAHGDLPAARALAEAEGLSRVRELLHLTRAVTPADAVDDVADPEGIEVTAFRAGADEEAWVRLNAAAFAGHPEQGWMGVADLRAREAEDWFDPDLFWLARPAGEPKAEPVASMWVKVVGEAGEIYVLGVHPAAQGRGLGRLLTRRALRAMAGLGLSRATLYVEGDNVPARRTYEREGFRCAAIDVQYS